MRFKKLCCVTLAMSMLTAGSATLTANATEKTSYNLGDVNLDGKINNYDISSLYDYFSGEYKPSCTDKDFLKIADIDSNGKIDEKDLNAFIDEYIKAYQVIGDVNLDGVFNVIDATYVQKYIVGNIDKFSFGQTLSADFNKDNEISILDATSMQKEIVNSTSSFPTAEVKNNDAKYRKAYSKYLTSDVLAAMKGCYLIENDEFVLKDNVIYFRDSTWLYQYVKGKNRDNGGLRVVGTYDLNNKDIVFPSKTDGGVTVDGVGCADSRSEGVSLGSDEVFAKGALGFSFATNSKFYFSDYYGLALNSIFIPSNYDIEGDSLKLNLGLQYVFLSDNVTLHERCFYGDSNLKQIKFPDTIIKIPISVVSGCENLTYVKIPNSVKRIDTSAFSNTGLSKIILGKNVEVIKDSSFQNTPLKEVYVYNPTMTIGPAAFYNDNMITNGYINPKCTFYGYKPSTLLEWLQEKKADFDEFEGPMVYKFALIK